MGHSLENRIPARRIAAIAPAVRRALDHGETETRNLVECLAIDTATLLAHAVPGIKPADITRLRAAATSGWLDRTRLAAALIYERLGPRAITDLADHPADTVRGWVAGVVALLPQRTLARRLALVRPFADDRNSNTRETAWLLMRPHIATDIAQSLHDLTPWVHAKSPHIRRFAVEITRPRGVWCNHIPVLKEHPELALPLLEVVSADPARYVQDSVGNWLNDASKTRPEFVLAVTDGWRRRSASSATEYICRRARRTIAPRPRLRR